MSQLWLLKGDYEAPGWKALEKDAKEDNIDWLMFDRDAWALVRAEQAPAYEGMQAVVPPDGIYIDHNGNSVCLVDRREVAKPEDVIAVLGEKAGELLEKIKDPVAVLERLGRAY